MLDQIRVGDTIVEWKLDRLARSTLFIAGSVLVDTMGSVSDQIFEFSQRLNRFSAPLLPNTQHPETFARQNR